MKVVDFSFKGIGGLNVTKEENGITLEYSKRKNFGQRLFLFAVFSSWGIRNTSLRKKECGLDINHLMS